uniref:Uncharacterized protein n=1 Tax=Arundo donax TaxID=35708 RepID=A0A0A9ACW1_ARUDO
MDNLAVLLYRGMEAIHVFFMLFAFLLNKITIWNY